MNECAYCYQPRADMTGWHDCAAAQAAKALLDNTIDSIVRVANGATDNRPMTSAELRNRADYRRNIADQVRRNGGKVKPEYEPIERTNDDEDDE